jgi:hypothetical protein
MQCYVSPILIHLLNNLKYIDIFNNTLFCNVKAYSPGEIYIASILPIATCN